MKYKINQSSFAPLATVQLDAGEKIKLERGAMIYKQGDIKLTGKMNSNGKKGLHGATNAFGRALSSGESFFISEATGNTDNSILAIAPKNLGKIISLDITAEKWCLNTSAFLACDENVTYNMKRQKLSKALFSGTGGLFVMETQGTGTLLAASYGDAVRIDVTPDKPLVVDNSNVVAWSNSLDYKIKFASGVFGFKTGEGLVNEFQGTGTVYIQTRNVLSAAS